METVENKYITLAYKLYTIENGEKEFTEEAPAEHPFQFISGLGCSGKFVLFCDDLRELAGMIDNELIHQQLERGELS